MKVIIQIPCLNEEATLPMALAELPRSLPGVERVEWLVIDDGSSDETARVAHEFGVDHVVRHTCNLGLAAAFSTGVAACLERGADIIVNTDADAQYPGRYIAELVAPIVEGRADVAIGDRQVESITGFSRTKKILQRVGSAAVRLASGTDVADAPSGFRAFSREAALRINVTSRYTYTLDTIIQAGKKNLTIAQVPIRTHASTRKSRLMAGVFEYVSHSGATVLHLFTRYSPVRMFGLLSIPLLLITVVLWGRYLVLHAYGEAGPGTHVPSVVVGGVALVMAFLVLLAGILADLLAMNRQIEEETLYYLKRLAFGKEPAGKTTAAAGEPHTGTEARLPRAPTRGVRESRKPPADTDTSGSVRPKRETPQVPEPAGGQR